MYSYEDRLKAIKLYIKYGFRESVVIQELGFPSRKMIKRWYTEYTREGNIPKKFNKSEKYSSVEKKTAVDYYIEHKQSIAGTVKILGYPSRPTLRKWIVEFYPSKSKLFTGNKRNNIFTNKEKSQAVIDLCLRETSAEDVANVHGSCRGSLYKWKRELMPEKNQNIKIEDKDNCNIKSDFSEKVIELKKQINKLKLERDVLEKANEILKKDLGINHQNLANREKAELIDTLKRNYSLNDLLNILEISKSTYFYNSNKNMLHDKYKDLRVKIKGIFSENDNRYGYRRIYIALKKNDIKISEKVIRRIMKEENLAVITKKNRKYSSYQGEISPEVDNIINRDFHSELPNKKWLTDITEFRIPAGKIYLSPIIDCFDGMVVSWSIGTSPNSELVTSMLDRAIQELKENEKPIVHSDRGAHYRWDEWIKIMNNAGLKRSMSKKGCSPDNAACEVFFGRLKNEMFYHRDWLNTSIDVFIDKLNQYLNWYNNERIKKSLGIYSLVENRKRLGYS